MKIDYFDRFMTLNDCTKLEHFITNVNSVFVYSMNNIDDPWAKQIICLLFECEINDAKKIGNKYLKHLANMGDL